MLDLHAVSFQIGWICHLSWLQQHMDKERGFQLGCTVLVVCMSYCRYLSGCIKDVCIYSFVSWYNEIYSNCRVYGDFRHDCVVVFLKSRLKIKVLIFFCYLVRQCFTCHQFSNKKKNSTLQTAVCLSFYTNVIFFSRLYPVRTCTSILKFDFFDYTYLNPHEKIRRVFDSYKKAEKKAEKVKFSSLSIQHLLCPRILLTTDSMLCIWIALKIEKRVLRKHAICQSKSGFSKDYELFSDTVKSDVTF